MESVREVLDQQVLMVCEEIEQSLEKIKNRADYNEQSPYFCRMNLLKSRIATERRMIEEVSIPCRFILEHFSLFLGKWDYTIGFKYDKIQAGRGLLSDIEIKQWGNISLSIGGINITWRDADYNYMFYPDKVILRPKDINKTDIYLYFSYAFKYSNLLERFQDVQHHEQTIYWHEDMNK